VAGIPALPWDFLFWDGYLFRVLQARLGTFVFAALAIKPKAHRLKSVLLKA